MSLQQRRKKQRQLIVDKVELQKQLLDVEKELQLCEFDAEHDLLLTAANRSLPEEETREYVERTRHLLEPEHLECLEKEYHGTSKAAFYLRNVLSESSIRRELNAGTLEGIRSENGRWKVRSIAIVDRLIDASSQEEI